MADETRESKIKDCQIQAFWQRFLKANPRNQSPLTYEDAWSFGDIPQMADELAALVLAGKKTATTSAAALYEIEQEALPQSGTYSVHFKWVGCTKSCSLLRVSVDRAF